MFGFKVVPFKFTYFQLDFDLDKNSSFSRILTVKRAFVKYSINLSRTPVKNPSAPPF